MTDDEIIQIAVDATGLVAPRQLTGGKRVLPADLLAFARAVEREAMERAARVAYGLRDVYDDPSYAGVCHIVAAAIRAEAGK